MRLARAIAFGVPLALFVIAGAPSSYWLDSGEFVATSVGLAVAHPPGHPLYVLSTKLVTLLPLGPLAFRVSLASALAAAACALVLFGAGRRIARAAGATEAASTALAFAGAIAVTTAQSFGLQAVRAEVYALQALLTIGALALAALAITNGDRRNVVAAALCAGLSLSNHHFLGLLAFPSLAAALALASLRGGGPAEAPEPTAPGPGGLVRLSLAAGLVGLVPYLALPLRAAAPESVSAPDDLADFFWVVSAKVYQKSAENAAGGLAGIADVVLLLAEDLAGLGLLAAVAGIYVCARIPALRRHGAVWVPAALVYPLARAWLGFIRDNPDAAGYVAPGLAALGLCAVAFGGALLSALPASRPEIGRIGLLVSVAMAVVIGPGRFDRYSLARFWAAEDLVSSATDDLGPRGVLVASHFETSFVAAGMRATLVERPDVSIVALPFLGYPGYAGNVARRDPTLRSLVRGTLLAGTLPETELAEVASMRPTIVEPDIELPPEVLPYLQPRGPFARAFGEPVSIADLVASGADHRVAWAEVGAKLGAWARDDRETRNVLLWHRYLEALLFASRGVRDLALESAEAAEAVLPGTPELQDLRIELRKGRGPLDTTPFLPRTGFGRP